MKQTNNLPRRVGYSLLTSLNSIAYALKSASNISDSTYYEEVKLQMIRRNNNLFNSTDMDALDSILTFAQATIDQLERGNPIPTGSFITIAKHSKASLKYVSTPTAVGIVLTTAMLKRILDLATTVGADVNGNTKSEKYIRYVCEHDRYSRQNSSAEFVRLLDILRYFDEIDSQVIEISLEGVHNDWKIDNRSNRSYYARHSNTSSESVSAMFPMVSDRYQEDSWKHYLTTLYSGLTNLDSVCAIATTLPKSVMLAELKGVTV
jgi:hypothetical protein